jgi:DNA-binding transcriptional LysR family regulator
MATKSTLSRKLRRVLTFRQLEVLCALAETGGVGAAAAKLNLTQPSASMQLKKLSDHLGTALFEIHGRQLNLTEAGQEAVAAANEVFASLERLEITLNALQGLHAGVLKVGAVTSAECFVPHILGPFCKKYPDIDVHLAIGNRAEMAKRLADNRDDLYFFADAPSLDNLDALPFGANKLFVIASSKHPLAKKSGIRWQDLSADTLLLREEGSGTRRLLENHLIEHQLSMPKHRVIASNEGIKHAVLAQLGIAVVPAHTLDHGDRSELIQLDVQDFPIHSHWCLVSHCDKEFSILAKTFREFLLHEGGDMLTDGLAYWERYKQPRLPS